MRHFRVSLVLLPSLMLSTSFCSYYLFRYHSSDPVSQSSVLTPRFTADQSTTFARPRFKRSPKTSRCSLVAPSFVPLTKQLAQRTLATLGTACTFEPASSQGSRRLTLADALTLHSGSASPTVTAGFPVDSDCPGGLRAEIRFPSCYNGGAYKADQSHVAFSDGESGPCPTTHKIRIPTLFFEVFYSVDDFKDRRKEAKNPKSPFVLAMGDPTGLGIHADFLNGA